MKKSYTITFITLDGNKMQVVVDAYSREGAIVTFKLGYEFESIKYCEENES